MVDDDNISNIYGKYYEDKVTNATYTCDISGKDKNEPVPGNAMLPDKNENIHNFEDEYNLSTNSNEIINNT